MAGDGEGWEAAVEVGDDEVGAAIEEAALMEVMRRLEAEITGDGDGYDDGDAGGGWGWCRCPFVTINGNEESCGPSFSDSSSTVMASFDVAAAGVGGSPPVEMGNGGSWLVRAEGIFWPACGGGAVGDGGLDVGGESEVEWLERVLNCTGPGLEYEAVVEKEMVVAPCLWQPAGFR